MSETRQLLVIHKLPERTGSEILLMLRVDVADARDLLQSKLKAVSHRYTNTGWVADPDGIQYGVRDRTISATLQLTRPSS